MEHQSESSILSNPWLEYMELQDYGINESYFELNEESHPSILDLSQPMEQDHINLSLFPGESEYWEENPWDDSTF